MEWNVMKFIPSNPPFFIPSDLGCMQWNGTLLIKYSSNGMGSIFQSVPLHYIPLCIILIRSITFHYVAFRSALFHQSEHSLSHPKATPIAEHQGSPSTLIQLSKILFEKQTHTIYKFVFQCFTIVRKLSTVPNTIKQKEY